MMPRRHGIRNQWEWKREEREYTGGRRPRQSESLKDHKKGWMGSRAHVEGVPKRGADNRVFMTLSVY